ncbi:MAG: hypothetical protein ACI9CO_000967, partial [Candidatus Azotimanducaceae bacterium]
MIVASRKSRLCSEACAEAYKVERTISKSSQT